MLTIVLLPGMDGTGSLFAPFISALGNDFNFVTVRYPTTMGLGYRELEEIAKQSLPTQGNFVILGESFSGPIAVALASKNPKGLVGLVLCSTFIRNPRPRLKRFRVVSDFLPVKLTPAFIYSYFLLGRAATPLLKSSIMAAVGQVSSKAFRARLRAVLNVDVSAEMKLVQVPTLYLVALQDRLVPLAASSYVTSVRPDTQVIPVDAPHFLLQVASDEAASLIRKFACEVCGP
jgi:pimeloyl-ACP methyl ester carboxylesterase